MTSKLDSLEMKQIMTVLGSYYALKNALVATDGNAAAAASKQLIADATEASGHLQATGSVHYAEMRPYLDTIIVQSKLISAETDKRCEKQRIAFSPLSDALVNMLKTADLKNAGVYKQYCPMAFNDKGAYWLSDVNEIKNPYFGKKMLECGEVTDSL
ncbi:MAG: DUF3347 domain-containing protein [Taibaiella sp.]|nr:DUF3347 domain-containing protein [Taibaiella sp.]